MSNVQIRDNTDKQRFEAVLDDVVVGFAEYELGAGEIVFLHTEVDDAREGEGIGSRIVRGALDAVRADGGLRARLKCPFFRSWVARHDEYADVLAS